MSFSVVSVALLRVLPYVRVPDLGPFSAFGLLVCIGIITGAKIAHTRALRLSLDVARFDALVFWTVAVGLVSSHVLDVVLYFPHIAAENRWALLLSPRGLSSFGGFVGAAAAFLVYSRRYPIDRWKSADAIAYGMPFAWFFGRLGCTFAHDHPGIASDSALAVAYPGGSRLDMGLLEMLLTPVLMLVVMWAARPRRRAGSVIASLALVYPLIRFPIDFLRAAPAEGGDVRYLGLTLGHYGSASLFLLGVVLWQRSRRAPGVGGRRDAKPRIPPAPSRRKGLTRSGS